MVGRQGWGLVGATALSVVRPDGCSALLHGRQRNVIDRMIAQVLKGINRALLVLIHLLRRWNAR